MQVEGKTLLAGADTSFSRSGLIDQLVLSGFTRAQAEYGVNQVGL